MAMEPRLAGSCSLSLHPNALNPPLWGMRVIRGSITSSAMPRHLKMNHA